MNSMKSLTSLAVTTMTTAGCVMFSPISSDIGQLDVRHGVGTTERVEQIKKQQEEYRKKFENTLLFLGEDTHAVIKGSNEKTLEIVAEGFALPFESGNESRNLHNGEEVTVVTKVTSSLDSEMRKRLQLYVCFFDGVHYMGVGTKDPYMAQEMEYTVFSVPTEVSSGVTPKGVMRPFTSGDVRFDTVFGQGNSYGMLSNDHTMFISPQRIVLFLEGVQVASIEFHFAE